ncbi:PFAM short-chain dehydrogenase reductase SDR (plasmid) [Vibrio sp. B1REV9]|uniref:SDR family NAD(P)-dependent oxidoreductase n=1 Tax=Vibrio sp. B1REV9 TaxID=2751179 RepID=UPI001AEC9F68|nr:SDR family NAD(P)-dependent oxidoreductase [Vibrio sp. B1REV9]CAE6958756.1 PFAM short-chain dehydrogenase reductase SDR [Vibrio sp. B1REV9]
MKHQGKVVWVTGAGQGIGQAVVKQFAQQGAKVAAIDINESAACATAEVWGGNVIGIGCDVSDSSSVRDAMVTVARTFGKVDIMVNCAGVGSVDAFIDTPDENWQKVIGVNLTGTFVCCREGAKVMLEQGKGSIINVASTAAMTGEGPSHYCASKAGVMGLTRSIARELAPNGIRVNTIVPGPTNTPMMADIPDEWTKAMVDAIPLGRMGESEDIAKVASFLASDDAAFVTGQNIAVNGGMAFI